jgi:hypothetical protein
LFILLSVMEVLSESLFSIFKIVFAGTIFIIHRRYARDDRKHRRFPHTFTFGIISTILSFLLFNSLLVTITAFVAFITHIICDNHIDRALKADIAFWTKIIQKTKTGKL